MPTNRTCLAPFSPGDRSLDGADSRVDLKARYVGRNCRDIKSASAFLPTNRPQITDIFFCGSQHRRSTGGGASVACSHPRNDGKLKTKGLTRTDRLLVNTTLSLLNRPSSNSRAWTRSYAGESKVPMPFKEKNQHPHVYKEDLCVCVSLENNTPNKHMFTSKNCVCVLEIKINTVRRTPPPLPLWTQFVVVVTQNKKIKYSLFRSSSLDHTNDKL